jgi:hypothetical protein
MPDFDVGAVSLQTPPPSAVIQPCRPAVLVKNNGVHDALAVGSLRIYSPAGLLIFTTALYSGVIAPGGTQPAQGVDSWTPPALGRYMVIAYVSCINDQDPTNDNLAPCFIQIIPGPPTPPTPVQLHAAQHEEGGGDEIIIDGLHGRTADAQIALAHKASHQAAGSDQLDVSGLPGILAQGQPIADHHSSHEDGGGDELNVDELSGVLKNLQKPKVHANESHDPNFATAEALSDHLDDTHDVHTDADNLEQTNQKGNKNGYCPLDDEALVPAVNLPTVAARDDAVTLNAGTNSGEIASITVKDHLHTGYFQLRISVPGYVLADAGPNQYLSIDFKQGSDVRANLMIPIPGIEDYNIMIDALAFAVSQTTMKFAIEARIAAGSGASQLLITPQPDIIAIPTDQSTYSLLATLVNPSASTTLHTLGATSRLVIPT